MIIYHVQGQGQLDSAYYLHVHLLDVIKNEIHVLVESNDDPFETHIDNVIQPDLN